MCLPRIGEIVAIDGIEALVATSDARQARVSLLCVPSATVGDHVMIHAGHAIDLLDATEAAERQGMIDEVTGMSGAAVQSAEGTGDRR